jgi:hypothetical protein
MLNVSASVGKVAFYTAPADGVYMFSAEVATGDNSFDRVRGANTHSFTPALQFSVQMVWTLGMLSGDVLRHSGGAMDVMGVRLGDEL